jgi:hypothetical protein
MLSAGCFFPDNGETGTHTSLLAYDGILFHRLTTIFVTNEENLSSFLMKLMTMGFS